MFSTEVCQTTNCYVFVVSETQSKVNTVLPEKLSSFYFLITKYIPSFLVVRHSLLFFIPIGKLERTAILKAICAGFQETADPPICLSGGQSTLFVVPIVMSHECINRCFYSHLYPRYF